MLRPNVSAPRPEPSGPNAASDAEIESAIRTRATTERDWAAAWATLRIAKALEAIAVTLWKDDASD
jgi:hypothetical protein